MHRAAESGHLIVARLLVGARADVNMKSSSERSDGWTPLHWAAEKGRLGIARLLLQAGAHMDVKERCLGRSAASSFATLHSTAAVALHVRHVVHPHLGSCSSAGTAALRFTLLPSTIACKFPACCFAVRMILLHIAPQSTISLKSLFFSSVQGLKYPHRTGPYLTCRPL